jgi:hypothetical protein
VGWNQLSKLQLGGSLGSIAQQLSFRNSEIANFWDHHEEGSGKWTEPINDLIPLIAIQLPENFETIGTKEITQWMSKVHDRLVKDMKGATTEAEVI